MNDRSEILRVLTGFVYFRRVGGPNTVLVNQGQSVSNSKFRQLINQDLSCLVKDGWEFYYSESTLSAYNDLALLDTNWKDCKSLLTRIDHIAGQPFGNNSFRLVELRLSRG